MKITSSRIIDWLWIISFFLLFTFGAVTSSLYVIINVIMLMSVLCYRRFRIQFTDLYGIIWIAVFFVFSIMVGYKTGYVNKAINISAIETVCMFASLSLYVTSMNQYKRLLYDYAFSSFLFGCICIITSKFDTWGTTRFGGITERGRNTIAFILGIAAVIFIYFYFEYKKRSYLIYAIVCAIVTIVTGSRKGILQLIIPVFIYIIAQKNFKKTLKSGLIILFIGSIILILLLNNEVFMKMYGDRFWAIFSIFSESKIIDSSVKARNSLATIGIASFMRKPFTGWGLGSSWELVTRANNYYIDYFHNNILEILACTGLVGFFWYHFPLFKSIIYSYKNRMNSYLSLLVLIIGIVFITISFGQITVYYCHFYAIIYFIFGYNNLVVKNEIS